MGNYWVDQGTSAGIGFHLGLLAPVVSRGILQGYHRVRASTEMRPPDFRAEDIQFFALNQWSPIRRLHRSHVQVEFDDRPWNQDWCDQGVLDQIGRDVANRGGPSSTLRAMEVDHRG